jgi:hypothetical protein
LSPVTRTAIKPLPAETARGIRGSEPTQERRWRCRLSNRSNELFPDAPEYLFRAGLHLDRKSQDWNLLRAVEINQRCGALLEDGQFVLYQGKAVVGPRTTIAAAVFCQAFQHDYGIALKVGYSDKPDAGNHCSRLPGVSRQSVHDQDICIVYVMAAAKGIEDPERKGKRAVFQQRSPSDNILDKGGFFSCEIEKPARGHLPQVFAKIEMAAGGSCDSL